MANDCEVYDADSSKSCNSFTDSLLTPFVSYGQNRNICICREGYSFNYNGNICTTGETNRCSDPNAHNCRFSGFSFTGTCVPNALLDDSGQCVCNIGYFEDVTQGENRNRCQECTIPTAPCVGGSDAEQGELPFVKKVAWHPNRKIHGACIVEDNNFIGVATVNNNEVNYFSFDSTLTEDQLKHEKYIKLEGEELENPKTICQHGSDGNVLIFDSTVRGVNIKSDTDRGFVE
jgi:hypothetical protein